MGCEPWKVSHCDKIECTLPMEYRVQCSSHFVYGLPSSPVGGWFQIAPQMPNARDVRVPYRSEVLWESQVIHRFSAARGLASPTPKLFRGQLWLLCPDCESGDRRRGAPSPRRLRQDRQLEGGKGQIHSELPCHITNTSNE